MNVRSFIVTVVGASTLLAASIALGQMGGHSMPGAVPGTITPLSPNLPAPLASPVAPAQQWVPEQRAYDPATGRLLLIPQHNAEVTPDGRLIQPPLVVPSPAGRPPVFLPGGQGLAPGVAP